MNQNNKSTVKTTATATTASTRPSRRYERQINDDVQVDNPTQECVFSEPTTSGLQNSRQRSSTVLNLVTAEQSKWRKQVRRLFFLFLCLPVFFQVQQQRQSVYNRHELLN